MSMTLTVGRLARRFARDRRGVVAMSAPILLILLLGLAAFAVDLGRIYTERRRLQSAADLAAIAAASDLQQAERAARASIQANGYGDGALSKLAFVRYAPDPALAPPDRVTPAARATANGAHVRLQDRVPLVFGLAAGFARGGRGDVPISAEATASSARFAEFSIGSRLAAVRGGIANKVLGALFGGEVSLDAVDYRALADARIDLFSYSDALASEARLTGPTYSDVLNADLTVGDMLAAAKTVTNGDARRALEKLARGSDPDRRVDARGLFDFGPYARRRTGARPAMAAEAPLYGLIEAVAQATSGPHIIDLDIAAPTSPLADVSVTLAIGERPQGTSWVSIGTAGAVVHTAQVRVLLRARIDAASPIASIDLPVYVEAASATASLSTVDCGARDAGASVAVTPAVVTAVIGDVDRDDLFSHRAAPDPRPARLVDIAHLARVSGSAKVRSGALTPRIVRFDAREISKGAIKTVESDALAESLITSVIDDTRIDVQVLGLQIGLTRILRSGVSSALKKAAKPLDAVLEDVLAAAGVHLGEADVSVGGAACAGGVIVG